MNLHTKETTRVRGYQPREIVEPAQGKDRTSLYFALLTILCVAMGVRLYVLDRALTRNVENLSQRTEMLSARLAAVEQRAPQAPGVVRASVTLDVPAEVRALLRRLSEP
jgi:hypothetical protein